MHSPQKQQPKHSGNCWDVIEMSYGKSIRVTKLSMLSRKLNYRAAADTALCRGQMQGHENIVRNK